MQIKTRLTTSLFGIFLLSPAAFAAAQTTAAPATPSAPVIPNGTLVCPAVDKLVKDAQTQIWYAPDGWRSYEQSFAQKPSRFLGAQWQGVGVGNVTCLYASDEKLDFPIQLVFHKLGYEPSGGAWGKNVGGYIDCKPVPTPNKIAQNDCYFKPVTDAQIGDVYQEAAGLKPQTPEPDADNP